jgi:HlyD family secretion protein
LGIEEQRVRVTIDFVDGPKSWSALGHDYRVTVHVTVWNSDNAIAVPVGALFRKGDSWAVYLVKEGRARIALVQIGRRNTRVAEVISGLSVGDQLVLYPSDRISDGVRVAKRENR